MSCRIDREEDVDANGDDDEKDRFVIAIEVDEVEVVVATMGMVARGDGSGGGCCLYRGVFGILDLLGISREGLDRWGCWTLLPRSSFTRLDWIARGRSREDALSRVRYPR